MMATETLAPTVPEHARDRSIDAARGVAICLVVFGHTWRGVFDAGFFPDTALFEAVDSAIYLFHMPLFFLLSGLFFERALTKSPRDFLTSRVMLLLYPLVIWTWAMGLAKVAAQGVVNQPLTLDELPLIPLPPQWQFWFLWALFGIQIVSYALGRQTSSNASWIGLAAAAVLLHWLAHATSTDHWTFIWIVHYAPFFVLGVLIARIDFPLNAQTVTAAALVFLAAQASVVFFTPTHPIILVLLAAPCALAVFLISCAFGRRFSATKVVHGLAYLGVASMPIYLAHTFFAAPARIALGKFGVTDLAPHVIIGTLVGLLFPLLLAYVAQRMKVSRLLGF